MKLDGGRVCNPLKQHGKKLQLMHQLLKYECPFRGDTWGLPILCTLAIVC